MNMNSLEQLQHMEAPAPIPQHDCARSARPWPNSGGSTTQKSGSLRSPDGHGGVHGWGASPPPAWWWSACLSRGSCRSRICRFSRPAGCSARGRITRHTRGGFARSGTAAAGGCNCPRSGRGISKGTHVGDSAAFCAGRSSHPERKSHAIRPRLAQAAKSKPTLTRNSAK